MNAVATTSPPRANWMHNYVWLIKREVWEHRAIYIAPLVFAVVVLVGVLFSLNHLDQGVAALETLDEHKRLAIRMAGYLGIAIPFGLVMSVVIGYYCLDALYADRKDRSMLFWKSLPLSDIETVVAKLAVACIVAPMIGLAVAVFTQLVTYIVMSVALVITGRGFMTLWQDIPVLDITLLVMYAVVVQALWYAPICAWCLLTSAWAKRSPFLWAVAPPVALMVLESLVFGTHRIGAFLGQRLNGVFPMSIQMSGAGLEIGKQKVASGTMPSVYDLINPHLLLVSPELWIGLIATGALIAATIWVRRYRDVA
jgi:ABC-2 type transport system permease protein